MIHIRPGSHAGSLLNILSATGEFPYSSLRLLGNERWLRAMVHKLTNRQTLYNSESGARITCKLLNLSGKGYGKTIRLTKAAFPILEWISPKALVIYLDIYNNHKFSGDAAHVERNHRIAESAAMCMRMGMEYKPYKVPKLQNEMIISVIPNEPIFYMSRCLKSIGHSEMNKTMFTRMVGAIFSNHKCFAVYNTRNSVMKWNGMGEFKARHNLIEIARMNAGINDVDSAILFGQSDKILLDTLMVNEANHRLEFRFDGIYRHIHFVPLNEYGIRLLKLICMKDASKMLIDILFESDSLANGLGSFEYDAYINNKYILCHLDGDVARLIRFKEAISVNQYDSEVICFEFQADYLRAFLNGLAKIKVLEMSLVETELGL